MRAALIYFSGTGNSKRILDFAKSNIPFECDVFDVIKDEIVDMNNYDYLMVFYPIYGFNAPKPIIDYVKKIQKVNENKKCLVMKNSGEHLFWNNGSSLYLKNILKRRGGGGRGEEDVGKKRERKGGKTEERKLGKPESRNQQEKYRMCLE